MSIVAVNWAMEQKTDGPSAQAVLFVIADRCNEHGVCRHADPETIASKTRQSRATVFRRLEELERVGAVTRITRHLEDGRREYEIKCTMAARVNYRVDRQRNIEVYDYEDDACGRVLSRIAYDGSSTQSDEPESQIETEGGSQIETQGVSPVRLPESHSCDLQDSSEKNPSKSPKNPPNPPSGGGREVDPELEADLDEAKRTYPGPITDMPRLRTVMGAMAPPERRRVLLGIIGYAAFIAECTAKGKSRAVKDAHRWVADGMHEGYVPAGERAQALAQQIRVARLSPSGKAWETLHEIAHIRPFLSQDEYLLPRELTPQELALASAPPERDWPFIPATEPNQCGAWNRLISGVLAGKARPALAWERNPGGVAGFRAPWPWPPRKDGTIGTAEPATEPIDEGFT